VCQYRELDWSEVKNCKSIVGNERERIIKGLKKLKLPIENYGLRKEPKIILFD
jgi:hypothetical protein